VMKHGPSATEEAQKRGMLWALCAYFAQIPAVIWYSKGQIPIHPVVLMARWKSGDRQDWAWFWYGPAVLCYWLYCMQRSHSAGG